MSSRCVLKRNRRILALGILLFSIQISSRSTGATGAERKSQEDWVFANKLYARGWFDLAGTQFLAFSESYPNHEQASASLELAGKSFESVKSFDKATQAYRRYLEKFSTPTNRPKVLLKLGDVGWRAKNYREARSAMEEFLRLRAKSPAGEGNPEETIQIEYRIAWCFKLEGNLDKAITAFRDFIVAHLDTSYEILPMAQVAIGQCYLEKKEYELAIEEFKKTMSEFRNSKVVSDAWLGVAEAQLRAERPQECVEALAKFETVSGGKSDPATQAHARIFLAEAKQKMGDLAAAGKLYEAVASSRAGFVEGALAKKKLGEMYAGGGDLDSMTPDALMSMANLALSQSKSAESFRAYQAVWLRAPKGPTAPNALAGMGKAMALEEKYFEASACFLTLWDLFPNAQDLADILFTAGACLYKIKAADSAILALDAFVSKNPSHAKSDEATFLLAESYFQSKQFDQAVAHYQALAEKSGAQAERCQFRLAGCLLATQEYAKAKEAFKAFIAKYPEGDLRVHAEFRTVDCDQAMGLFRESVQGYMGLLDRYPDHALSVSGGYQGCKAALQTGEMPLFQSIWTKYERTLTAGLADPESTPKELNDLAYALFEKKKTGEAARAWARVVRLYPDFPMAGKTLFWVGEEMSRQKDTEAATAAYRACIQLDAASPVAKRAQYGLAEGLRKSGQKEEAIKLYKELMAEKGSLRLLGALGLGTAYAEGGDYASALEPLAAAARESQQTKDQDIASLGAEAWYLLGESYFQLSQYDKAKENLEMVAILPAFKKFPESQRKGLFRLAETYEKLDDRQGAFETYSRVAQEFPQTDEGTRSARKAEQLKVLLKEAK